MKKKILAAVALGISIAFSGCGEKQDPGTPPAEVIQGSTETDGKSGIQETAEAEANTEGSSFDSSVMENAVTIYVGQTNGVQYQVNMYNNAAAETMLGYLSGSDLLFPAYTYDEENGFCGQNIRGKYTRDDEKEITDIQAGELYLFSDGQLRLYFKDAAGADITATPVGYLAEAEGIEEAVIKAYEENKGDIWHVSVYFHLIKN